MNEPANAQQDSTIPIPVIRVPAPTARPDFATFFGLIVTFGLIFAAIMMGQSDADFLNIQSVMIVVLGTFTATCISFTFDEIRSSGSVAASAFFRPSRQPSALAKALMDISTVARKRGVLALANYEGEMQKEPFLQKAIQLVVDGYDRENIERMLSMDIASFVERQKRSASMLRRASEIAPAMGLIGTLVGLVQMLANLENPDTIGPAMAIALLTTFYGAILGTIVLAPMAAKLDKYTSDETMIKNLILKSAVSIVDQENPRSLEMILNSELPPSDQIRYFN